MFPQDPRTAQRAKRRRLLTDALSARIRRGLIRYLEVIVDLSRASATSDFRPTRFAVVLGVSRAGAGSCMLLCCMHRACQHLPLAAGLRPEVRLPPCITSYIQCTSSDDVYRGAAAVHPGVLRPEPAQPPGHSGAAQWRGGAPHRLVWQPGAPLVKQRLPWQLVYEETAHVGSPSQ